MENMESESGITTNTKISDSAYSNSCSNSNSQRSASSKSRHSGSNSSGSSGYCGTNNTVNAKSGNASDAPPPPSSSSGSKRTKEKKSKRNKSASVSAVTNNNANVAAMQSAPMQVVAAVAAVNDVNGVNGNTNSEMINLDTEAMVMANLDTCSLKSPKTIANKEVVVFTTAENAAQEMITQRVNEAGPPLSPWQKAIDSMAEMDQSPSPSPTASNTVCQQPEDMNKIPSQPDDGFCCVISMYDGMVLYTTPNLTTVLGFPKDMWLGRSFIDFVHPKDRDTFSSQITTKVVLPFDTQKDTSHNKHTFYACLRKYRGLKSNGYSVVEKAVSYEAFQLNITFRHITEKSEVKMIDSNASMFLVVIAVPVHSSYKVPAETRKSAKFGMRHTAACVFSHVDPDVVNNFGFLPQDMLGKSVFDFYHPEDMPFLKEVYESVLRMCQIAGSVFRSKPYRFAVQNGGFAMIETEWSSFVNPWSRRLEFVIGLHRVLQGPHNPNIFESPKEDEWKLISEEVLKESKLIQNEILVLLNTDVARPAEAVKHEVSKRCKDLATFMESLMDEVSRSNLQIDLPQVPDPTISERDSVMLGEISPHHEYYDSKSSSETPPSYNQLNYNENIQRFFQSKPKTTVSDGSGERSGPLPSTTDTDPEVKGSQENTQKCLSPVQNSGASGSGSAGNLSSGSNPNMETGTTSGTNTSNDSYKPPHLTEALLYKHNEEMEKMMVKKHRDHRTNIKADRENKKSLYSKNDKTNSGPQGASVAELTSSGGHGVKRSGSHSWEGDSHKVSKHKHQTAGHYPSESSTAAKSQNVTAATAASNENIYASTPINDVNLWPPFSVTMTPINNTQTSTAHTANRSFPTGILPIYYIPTPQRAYGSPENANFQMQYMPPMIFPASPIFCSPLSMMPVPVSQQMAAPVEPLTMSSQQQQDKGPQFGGARSAVFQRPASQATSVKAEPGSAMGSIASASVANKALSECSRKDALQSVCSPGSPLVSPPDGETQTETFYTKRENTRADDNMKYRDNHRADEESSYSSFYSSFLKTDTGSGSNDDCNNLSENQTNRSDDNSWTKDRCPIRKREPPWLEAVSITPELIYRYQMSLKGLQDILESDLNSLKDISQPMLVNDQLNQLYVEMELDGLSQKLTLDEGITSSSSSGEDAQGQHNRPRRKRRSYSSLMMIYEENAPFPSPE